VLAAVLLGVGLAVLMGRPFERLFFSPPDGLAPGMRVDMRRWLSGEYGAAWPGWVMVLAGPSAVLAAVANSVFLRRRIDRIAGGLSVGGSALLVLGRFVVLLGLSIGFAFAGPSRCRFWVSTRGTRSSVSSLPATPWWSR
jgi:hypothetical protein